ncbi:MAG: hypothetical protein CVV57_08150 [Tenericutes bacterium HGW-Tenericutes-2]|jgi:hypothetical protein|nr:MAG: hypothetical protein CVV57_08150 [Tenericutes bacterium HGW-Tenericutes-2]
MAYLILIWMITIILTIWMLYRVHQNNKYLKKAHDLNVESNSMNEYIRSKYCFTAIVIILMWWISFILLESFKLNFIQYQLNISYQIFALIIISPLIFYLQLKRRKFIKEKYNICMIKNDLRIEFVLALLTSIIYAQILSFAIESIMIIAV